MDHEKFYDKKHDGSYLVHFPNKGLTTDEVKNIFSSYGTVVSVDQHGDTFGLCFVRYKNLQDTMRCLNSLKNHQLIKILPHKKKIKNKSTTKNHKPVQERSEDSSAFSSINKFLKQNHLKNKDINRTDNKDYHYNVSPRSRRNSDGNSSTKTISSLRQLLKSKQSERSTSSTPISVECLDNSSSTIEDYFNENEIPSLICNNQRFTNHKYAQKTPHIIPAQEVIIANVHPELGSPEILSFFDEYKPIATSQIFHIPNIGLRYCHIYFESAEQAAVVEKKFDKYLWNGKTLIVLRLHVLAEQALLM
ncbi:uncharacterized protein LOC116430608 [Nomia melanderi]|uniref:uncharacterized protein LOC116430608 n=1 Tax=Nomia melanderi TaxID=2448451 RepID=UPI0013040874|nr:uncharacterized protein LOC116430608 [Nomia melanderi]